MKTCGEKISTSAGSGNEIAGLLKKKEDDDATYTDTKMVKLCVSRFSRGRLEERPGLMYS